MAWLYERSKEHERAAHGGPRPGCRKKATLGHKFLSVHQHFSLPPVAYEACRCSRIRSQRHNGPEGHGGIEPRARTEQISAALRRPSWSRPQKKRGDRPDRISASFSRSFSSMDDISLSLSSSSSLWCPICSCSSTLTRLTSTTFSWSFPDSSCNNIMSPVRKTRRPPPGDPEEALTCCSSSVRRRSPLASTLCWLFLACSSEMLCFCWEQWSCTSCWRERTERSFSSRDDTCSCCSEEAQRWK
ncbi:hypothetical protein EYF80_040198 [Liparis tanakae]|uniref:Uncharacterized protein n=1 Tax=Liparis tanakae TaxID=230148 RepID=A0A4Z2G8U2_9TELE|nr:hypothetical protein EYF80_040198 [Liparis tanakae]